MIVRIEICRICGSDQNLKYVDDVNLLEKLKICANITINHEDALPKHICLQCEQGLEFSYRLRKQGEETDRRLRLALQTDNEYYENVECLDEFIVDASTYADVAPPIAEQGFDNDDGNCANNEENTYNEQVEQSGDFDECYYLDDASSGEVEDFHVDGSKELGKAAIDEAPIGSQGAAVESKPNYTCATCLAVLPRQSDYRRHLKKHGDKRFQCLQCDKWFAKRFLLVRHERCHEAVVQTYGCTQCSQVFRDQWNLSRHERSVHGERVFLCTVCSQSFGRADVLKNHMVRHSDEKRFACKQCNASFKLQRNLDLHMRTHQPKQERRTQRKPPLKPEGSTHVPKTFTCPTCGKISRHHFAYENHLRTHTMERPFVCEMCDKTFRTMAAKTTHKLIHSDVRPHQCDICFASFRQRSHLKDHQLIHSDTNPFECGVCGMFFKKRCNMKVHMRTHEGGNHVKAPQSMNMKQTTSVLQAPIEKASPFNCLAIECAEERAMGELMHHVDICGTDENDLFLCLEPDEKFNSFCILDDITAS